MTWFKSRSKMKGHEMHWEWNWPRFWSATHGITWFSIDLGTAHAGDHSPRIHFSVTICNLCLIDCGYYNIYHEVDEEDNE